MLLAPALPGRSFAARHSPVASAKQYMGPNPKPPLWLGPVSSLFSECTWCNDASMSSTTVPVPVRERPQRVQADMGHHALAARIDPHPPRAVTVHLSGALPVSRLDVS